MSLAALLFATTAWLGILAFALWRVSEREGWHAPRPAGSCAEERP